MEEYNWLLSLASHFQEWLLILSILLLLFTPWVTKYKMLIFSITLSACFFYSWTVLPYWKVIFQKNITYVERSELINIFFANLNSQNQEKNQLLNYLKKTKPDFVFLVEVNNSWGNEIKKLKSLYPYMKAIVQEGNFGMAVLSKIPLETENVFVDRENMIPAMFLSSKSSIGSLNLILLHAHPPIGHYGTILRDRYLETLSRKLNDFKSPSIICGDFNTTPWTSIFQKFLRNSALESSKSHLPPNTWPKTLLLPGLPIDHCLSKGLKIVKYSKGPDIGSDHWPLIIQISNNSNVRH